MACGGAVASQENQKKKKNRQRDRGQKHEGEKKGSKHQRGGVYPKSRDAKECTLGYSVK